MKRKVLLYSPVSKGFIQEYSMNLSNAFSSDQFSVSLQTAPNSEWSQETPGLSNIVSNLRSPSEDFEYGTLAWAFDRYKMAFLNGVERLRLAQRMGADVVHVQLILPWVDAILLPLHKAKVVCTVHDVVPHFFRLPSKLDWLLRRRCYSVTDGLIFHSATNLEQYVTVYGSTPARSAIIPLGLTHDVPITESQRAQARRSLGIPTERPVILLFGEIRPNKGMNVLINAFSDVIKKVPNAFLLVGGRIHPTVDASSLGALLGSLQQGSYRWVNEWIPDNELALYFKAASVVALPYTSFASQSGVLNKAYANECPVVVTDVGSLGETVREDQSGLVVSPNDSKELAAAISELLTHQNRLIEYQKNIAKVCEEKYNWEKVALRTAEFYEEIVGLSS